MCFRKSFDLNWFIEKEFDGTKDIRELISYLKEENLPNTSFHDIINKGDESDMSVVMDNIIQILIASAPVTAAIIGILNCIKAYIEVNPKDTIKIKIRGVEIEMTNKNNTEIESTLDKILKIEEKYTNK